MCKKTIRSRNYRAKWVTRPYKKRFLEFGFSLVELLFTITLSSILLTLAFPVYRHLILELRLFILTERVSLTVHYAQTEAIRRQSTITVCKSKNGKSCMGSWNDGWIILENKELLRVYPAFSHSDFLVWHGFHSDDYLQLHPDGSSQNGSFVICVGLPKKMTWLVKISQTGRIRLDKNNIKNLDCNA